MEIKLFEIRDSMTFIPTMAIKVASRNEAERYLVCGASMHTNFHESPTGDYVLFAKLGGDEVYYDPNCWDSGTRTMNLAHNYIYQNFDELETGDVIDLEYIHGWSKTKKISQRFDKLHKMP